MIVLELQIGTQRDIEPQIGAIEQPSDRWRLDPLADSARG